jgi:DNA processing protein
MDLTTLTALLLVAGTGPSPRRSRLGAAVREAGPAGMGAVFDRVGSLWCEPADEVRRKVEDARSDAVASIERGAGAGLSAVIRGHPRYPSRLAGIYDPPPVLWYRGDLASADRVAVALVGARAASAYALDVAARLGEDLGRRGVTVVSGLARGVDAASHRGALAGGGRTIAVLGSGADLIYPAEHRDLAAAIAESGAVVSEFPPGSSPLPEHFPLRNRIISGLSVAVVIVEASEKSGSLITARAALDQSRDVMAVPGNVLSVRNRGSHALLKDGAKLVEGVDDILEGLVAPAGQPAGTSGANCLTDEPLLSRMEDGEPYTLEELEVKTGLAGPVLLSRLLELEMGGQVGRREAGRFVRLGKRC